jgi:hypothetical protein
MSIDTSGELDELIRDLTKVHPLPKGKVRALISAYVAQAVESECQKRESVLLDKLQSALNNLKWVNPVNPDDRIYNRGIDDAILTFQHFASKRKDTVSNTKERNKQDEQKSIKWLP